MNSRIVTAAAEHKKAPVAPPKGATGCLGILLSLLLFFGLFFGGALLFINRSAEQFLDQALKTDAIVSRTASHKSCDTTTSSSNRSGRGQTTCRDRYFVSYRFTDHRGLNQEGKSFLSEEDFALVKPGDSIPIWYRPDQPHDSRTLYAITIKSVPFGDTLANILLGLAACSLAGLLWLRRASR